LTCTPPVFFLSTECAGFEIMVNGKVARRAVPAIRGQPAAISGEARMVVRPVLAVDFDPFILYRWLLALICAIYVLVTVGQSLLGWWNYFHSSRYTAVLGRYTAVLLLRIRVRRFAWDLFQIAVLLVLLGGLLYAHWFLHPV